MQPEQHDAAFLWDMLDRARRVRQYVAGRTYEQYVADRELQDAVERCIEVIGEAARRVSEPFRQAHGEIAWRAIIAQRHVLAHEYGEIDPGRVYRVATVHVPELIARLEPLIPQVPPEEGPA